MENLKVEVNKKMWHRFKILNTHGMIMNGTYSIEDKHFKFESRGKQAAPSCLVAIVYGRLFQPKDWMPRYVDQILEYGDKLFRNSVRRNHNTPMKTTSVVPEFYIGKYKIVTCVEDTGIQGSLFNETMNCPIFSDGFNEFWKKNDAGVITVHGKSIATWSIPEIGYTYFDPGSCSPQGLEEPKGTACLLIFKNLEDLKNHFLDGAKDSRYCIDKVTVSSIAEVGKGYSKQGKNILRGKVKSIEKSACNVKINREALKTTISNTQMGEEILLVKDTYEQNFNDSEYSFENIQANVPSTFQQLSPGLFILRGTTHEGDGTYQGKGEQNLVNCVTSIVTKTIYPVKTWLPNKLDEILKLGDDYYLNFGPDLNNKKLDINSHKLIIEMDFLTVTGILNSKTSTVLNLKEALKAFFLKNKDGLIESTSRTVAVWKENDYFYTFDPRSCDEQGLRSGNGDGACCVLKFQDFNRLASVYLNNVDPDKKNDRFTIRRVGVSDYVHGTRAWNEFQPAETGKSWILRGGISNRDESFEENVRGEQGPAMAVVALVNANRVPIDQWTNDFIDNLVNDGHSYYVSSLSESNKSLTVTNLKKKFYLNERKINYDIEDSMIVGNVSDLGGHLSKYFNDHEQGIVETKNQCLGIWKTTEDDGFSYYMFDSNPRDELGRVNNDGDGVACVVRAMDPNDLSKIVETNESNSKKEFFIHNIKNLTIGSSMTEEELQRDKETIERPELHGYSSLNDNNTAGILLGTINLNNEQLFNVKTRGKQQFGTAMAVLAMAKLHDPHLWSSQTVDDVLKIADHITLDNIGKTQDSDYEFDIGVNRIRLQLAKDFLSGKNLTSGLKEFFQTNDQGILRKNHTVFSVWKQSENKVYFTMDPMGTNGPAAVMWFMNLDDFISNIQGLVSNDDENFFIDKVTSVENIYQTDDEDSLVKQEGGDGFSTITSNLMLNDSKFVERNRDKQTTCVAVTALIFSKVQEPGTWTSEILDRVIVMGDKLHSMCVERLNGQVPRIGDIITELYLFDRQINLKIIDCVEVGKLTNPVGSSQLQDFKTGIEKFFQGPYESGIITLSSSEHVAVWKHTENMYAFFSRWGEPRIMKFANFHHLEEYLIDNVKEKTNDYEISAIDVTIRDKLKRESLDPSSGIAPSNLPPFNAYHTFGHGRAILRGNNHQGDEIFPDDIRNKQTAANCIVAIGMTVIRSSITWTGKTLDEILALGCTVHRETQRFDTTRNRFHPKDITRIFHIGVNVITADVGEKIVTGLVQLAPVLPEDKKSKQKGGKKKSKPAKKKGKSTREKPPPPPPIYLEEGLKLFFHNNRAGILITGNRGMISIWKDFGVYFAYDARSKNHEGLPEPSGSCCAVWFACIEPLHQFIISNIEEEEMYSQYEICRVLVRTTIIEPLPCPVGFSSSIELENNFHRVDRDVRVLCGSVHMNDRTIDIQLRGYQSTAIAAVAIVVALVHVPSTWTKEIVDSVIKYGTLLHSATVNKIRCGQRNLSPDELIKVFLIADFRACLRIRSRIAAGILHVYDLLENLTMFFRHYCAGILHTVGIAVAVMQHYGKFYLYDPSACDEEGHRTDTNEGGACLMKFSNLYSMVNAFVNNCRFQSYNVYTIGAVEIVDLHFYSMFDTRFPVAACH